MFLSKAATCLWHIERRADPSYLKGIFLFGSSVEGDIDDKDTYACFLRTIGDPGSDAHIALEVEWYCFLNYLRACSLDHSDEEYPIVKKPHDRFWCYFSPRRDYIRFALSVVDVPLDKLDSTRYNIDVICLPVGWDVDGTVREFMVEYLAQSPEPGFLSRLQRQKKKWIEYRPALIG